MKRSEINQAIFEAIKFFKTQNFKLTKWAYWKPEEWKNKGELVKEIIENRLGWDITDFSSGNFEKVGLINFNLRNGILNKPGKNYCEKIIIVKENQVTPLHTHRIKVEDIINRGGGNLVLKLYVSDDNFNLTNKSVTVKIDSIPVTVLSGGTIILEPGDSIYLEPGVFHEFFGEEGKGSVLVGEVSSVNDDNTDNIFHEDRHRFPEIIEDEEPAYLLVNDYDKYI